MSEAHPKEKAAAEATPARSSRWGRLLTWRGVLCLIACGVMLQAAGLYLFVFRQPAAPADLAEPETPEVTLGSFQYVDFRAGETHTPLVAFQLHIEFLPDADSKGRAQLARRRFKVRQGIEQLLRQVRADQFDDPMLADLKNQIHESINRSLGLRVVDEVMITDLNFLSGDADPAGEDAAPEAAQGTEEVAAHKPS